MVLEEAARFNLHRDGEGLAYLQSPLLSEAGWLDHAFSTRCGGVSTGHLASLNTGFHVGDRWENVLENRRILFDHFNYDYRAVASANQVHGTEIRVFDKGNRGEGAFPDTTRSRCDALVTREKGLPLAAYSADCQLIFFACPGKEPVVAVAHAGWKGTLGNIGGRVARFLETHYSISPGKLLVGLAPVVCRTCYLVNREVAERFYTAGWKSETYLEPAGSDEFYLDLNAINAEQLLQAGINKEFLALNNWCTSCHPELFYSYRRDKGVTGRMIGFIAINNAGS